MRRRSRTLQRWLREERLYVAFLEKLQEYSKELQRENILHPSSVEAIFGNLDQVVIFHCKFLKDLVEKILLFDMTGIGRLIIENESGFAAYETFCAKQNIRIRRAIYQEMQNLMKKEKVMDPHEELSALFPKSLIGFLHIRERF